MYFSWSSDRNEVTNIWKDNKFKEPIIGHVWYIVEDSIKEQKHGSCREHFLNIFPF